MAAIARARYVLRVSLRKPIPRVLEIGIHAETSHRSVSAITHTMRSTRLLRDSGLSFEGLQLAVGLQLEQRKRWFQHSAEVSLMFLGAGEGKRKWTATTCFFVE